MAKLMRQLTKKCAWALAVQLVVFAAVFPQNPPSICPLENAKGGQTITVRGRTLEQPHDLGFGVNGCQDIAILTFAGDADNDVSSAELHRDKNLRNFQKFTRVGKQVEATLTGRIEIATIPPGTTKDAAGLLRDSSGKVVGTSGFGHPSRAFKYRLVILSASSVKALKPEDERK
jgi:hypothetical protein